MNVAQWMTQQITKPVHIKMRKPPTKKIIPKIIHVEEVRRVFEIDTPLSQSEIEILNGRCLSDSEIEILKGVMQ